MNRIKQESLAGRIQSSHSPVGYDCELPTGVRTELVAPKRPRILGRKTSLKLNPAAKWPLYLAALIAVLIVGGAALLWRQQEAERASSKRAVSQPLAPQPAQTAAPTPGPARSWGEYLTNKAPAPRATLVQPRAPRAQLVRPPVARAQLIPDLPHLIPGQRYLATMPYNLEVLATYRGEMASVDMLPSHRNRIGDMWVVGQVPWVWIWTPGATHADWIDP